MLSLSNTTEKSINLRHKQSKTYEKVLLILDKTKTRFHLGQCSDRVLISVSQSENLENALSIKSSGIKV